MQTSVPCVANNASFVDDDIKGKSFVTIIITEKRQQNAPDIATVVNFGVSFLHLSETENTAKPIADNNPKINPNKDPSL